MESVIENQRRVNDYYARVMDGHAYIRDTIDALLAAMDRRIRALGRPARILELGCHAGVTGAWFSERWPDAEIVSQDEREELVAMAREKLAGTRVQLQVSPIQALEEPFDFVVSIARHHHLPQGYLEIVRRALRPGGVYFVADELCPEYCDGEHAARIAQAELLHIDRGYVLTSRADVEAYKEKGTMPAHALELEQRRRRALWRWYRFVVDYAVDRGYFDIAVDELRATHDDLITGSDAEHKFSPSIVEREFALAGFQLLSKKMLGPEDPELQSMFVYELASP